MPKLREVGLNESGGCWDFENVHSNKTTHMALKNHMGPFEHNSNEQQDANADQHVLNKYLSNMQALRPNGSQNTRERKKPHERTHKGSHKSTHQGPQERTHRRARHKTSGESCQ